MQQIDVSDLPEPVARAIEAMVEALRKQLDTVALDKGEQRKELPLWQGDILGSLTREEIYDHDF